MKKRLVSAFITISALSLSIFTSCDVNSGENNNETEKSGTNMNDARIPEAGSRPEVTDEPLDYDISGGYEWGNVKIVGGGYTTGIIYNPSEEGLVYARTDIGGAYRMDKETGKWLPLTDAFNNDDYTYYGIDGLASDAREPNKVYLLAGMYGGWKSAVLRSDDYGENWEITELPFSCGGNEPNRFCDRIVIDPNDNKTIYVGSRTAGLWVSHDGGVSFSEMETPTAGAGYSEDGRTFGITAVMPDPSSSAEGEPCKTIYIGTGDRVNYVTRDGGTVWEELSLPKNMLVYHIDIFEDKVYFTMGSQSGPYQVSDGSLYVLTPATGEYSDISPDFYGKPSGFGDIAIDYNNPGIIYASTIGRWGSRENDNIFKTSDYGETWSPLFINDGEERIFEVDITEAPWLDWGEERAKLGWMLGCIALNPFNSDELMYGTGATIFASENLTDWGKTTPALYTEENPEAVNIIPVRFKVKCDGLEETAVLGLDAPNSDDVRLYSALGDIDGFTHTDTGIVPDNLHDGGYYGNSTSISSAFNNPLAVARAGNGNQCVSYSSDGGKTWRPSRPEGASGQNGVVEVNCDASALYWSNPASLKVFASSDGGENWKALDKSFANPSLETDNFDPDTLYVLTGGMLYISRDKGATFTMCRAVIPEKAKMTASPDEKNTLWFASAYGGVFRLDTSDEGSQCEKIGMQSASCMAFGAPAEKGAPHAMYGIGTNEKVYGVWRSSDGGATWQRINDDKHQFGAIGSSIAADSRIYGTVYFGSNGRGIIKGSIKPEQ